MKLVVPIGQLSVNQLHDELLQRFPSWRGVQKPDGSYTDPRVQVEQTATEIVLTMPDGTNESAVRAVIDAHVPRPPKDWVAIRRKAVAKVKQTANLTTDEVLALGWHL